MKECKSEKNDLNSKKTDKINSNDLVSRANNFYFDDTYNGTNNVNYPHWNKGKSSNILKNKLSRHRLDIHDRVIERNLVDFV